MFVKALCEVTVIVGLLCDLGFVTVTSRSVKVVGNVCLSCSVIMFIFFTCNPVLTQSMLVSLLSALSFVYGVNSYF